MLSDITLSHFWLKKHMITVLCSHLLLSKGNGEIHFMKILSWKTFFLFKQAINKC